MMTGMISLLIENHFTQVELLNLIIITSIIEDLLNSSQPFILKSSQHNSSEIPKREKKYFVYYECIIIDPLRKGFFMIMQSKPEGKQGSVQQGMEKLRHKS